MLPLPQKAQTSLSSLHFWYMLFISKSATRSYPLKKNFYTLPWTHDEYKTQLARGGAFCKGKSYQWSLGQSGGTLKAKLKPVPMLDAKLQKKALKRLIIFQNLLHSLISSQYSLCQASKKSTVFNYHLCKCTLH